MFDDEFTLEIYIVRKRHFARFGGCRYVGNLHMNAVVLQWLGRFKTVQEDNFKDITHFERTDSRLENQMRVFRSCSV